MTGVSDLPPQGRRAARRGRCAKPARHGAIGAILAAVLMAGGLVVSVGLGAPPAGAASSILPVPTWTELSPATSPAARQLGTMAYDSGTGQLVLFGGAGTSFPGGLRNDTWTFNGMTWTQLSPATSPPGRDGAVMAYDPATGQMVLFGGYSGGDLDDTWIWNGTNWAEASPSTSPPGLDGAAMAYDAGTGQLVLFGGQGDSGGPGNETWTWNGTTWTEQAPTTSPVGRSDAAMAYDPAIGQLVLFGGHGYSATFGDTWAWTGTNWTEQSPTTSPSGRSGASMAYDPGTGQLILFGGDGGSGEMSDTWTLSSTTWTEQSPTASPQGTVSGMMAYDPATGQLVLFGAAYSYTWYWGYPSGLSASWTQLSPATSPPGRSYAVMAFDAATGQTVLFGGNEASDLNQADTWTYQGGAWTEQSPATSPPGRAGASMAYDPATGQLLLFGGATNAGAASDTWTWTGSTWQALTPATSPPKRYGAAMAFDAATGQLVLFGGYGGTGSSTNLNDTWTWNGSNWVAQTPATSPPARAFPTMAYDAGTGQLVLFGGYGAAGDLSDTWTWTGSNWVSQSPATIPLGREFPSMVYDPALGELVVFGGKGSSGELSDTLAWVPSGDTYNWTDLSPAANPSARDYAAIAYDSADGQLIIFGGENTTSGDLGDTWDYGLLAAAPAAPEVTEATPGPGSATITWIAPSADGGTPITGYDVYEASTPGSESATPVNASPVAAGATSYTATGLTNGTPYFFKVRALNAVGKSALSNEAPVIPVAPPGAPSGLGAFSGQNQTVQLGWTDPTVDGGSAITGYDVYDATTAGGESETPVNSSPLPPGTTQYEAPGLSNGTTYYFTVEAINAIGESVASNEISATPYTEPDAPSITEAVPADTSVTLDWTAPPDGGNALTGYYVYEGTTPGGENGEPVNSAAIAPTATSYPVTGLTDGTTYYFRMTATNSDGYSSYSSEVSATPASVPEPVGSPKATAGNGFATVTWAAPTSDGGSAVTGYDVYDSTKSGHEGSAPVNSLPIAPATRTYKVTKLKNGTRYYFTVKAINGIGLSNASSEVSATPATVPEAPGSVKATAGKDDVKVAWAVPKSNGGSAVTGYDVYEGTKSRGESAKPVNAKPLSPSTKSLTVTKLKAGTKYFFVVTAVNARGTSVASKEVSATPLATASLGRPRQALVFSTFRRVVRIGSLGNRLPGLIESARVEPVRVEPGFIDRAALL